jgi:hypothetical protein
MLNTPNYATAGEMAQQPAPVARSIGMLGGNISLLFDELDDLERRLDPVLEEMAPTPPTPAPSLQQVNAPRASNSPMGHHLEDQAERIRAVLNRVRDISARLAI